MKILALECSAGPASVAILDNENLVDSSFTNVRLTHSQTLLPMLKQLLDKNNLTMSDIDALAISNGPGSFTGIRIGISAIKGLAAPKSLPCYAVSTLRAIVENARSFNGIICSVMDARCNQVYNALFRVSGGKIERLCEDRALMIDALMDELNEINDNILIVGDGAGLFEEYQNKKISIADLSMRYQNAIGVALSATEYSPISSKELMPFYLRLPQAERELKAKKENLK